MMATERMEQEAHKQNVDIQNLHIEAASCDVIEVAMKAADAWELQYLHKPAVSSVHGKRSLDGDSVSHQETSLPNPEGPQEETREGNRSKHDDVRCPESPPGMTPAQSDPANRAANIADPGQPGDAGASGSTGALQGDREGYGEGGHGVGHGLAERGVQHLRQEGSDRGEDSWWDFLGIEVEEHDVHGRDNWTAEYHEGGLAYQVREADGSSVASQVAESIPTAFLDTCRHHHVKTISYSGSSLNDVAVGDTTAVEGALDRGLRRRVQGSSTSFQCSIAHAVDVDDDDAPQPPHDHPQAHLQHPQDTVEQVQVAPCHVHRVQAQTPVDRDDVLHLAVRLHVQPPRKKYRTDSAGGHGETSSISSVGGDTRRVEKWQDGPQPPDLPLDAPVGRQSRKQQALEEVTGEAPGQETGVEASSKAKRPKLSLAPIPPPSW